jgi:hypothetical protein
MTALSLGNLQIGAVSFRTLPYPAAMCLNVAITGIRLLPR